MRHLIMGALPAVHQTLILYLNKIPLDFGLAEVVGYHKAKLVSVLLCRVSTP
jgi:hypothetical protein